MRSKLATVIEKTYGPLPKPPVAPFGTGDLHVMAIAKNATGERFVFLFDDDHRSEVLRTLARFASNPDLSFTWLDAAVLSQKVHQLK